MAYNANTINPNVATAVAKASTPGLDEGKANGKLDADAFMMLLLEELKNQDPTEPMDSEKILTQTSQLASLQSTDKTNEALEKLANSLGSANQFSTISAIGKIANTGKTAISYEKGKATSFEIYFNNDIKYGTVDIKNDNGNIVKTITLDEQNKGVIKLDWNGNDKQGKASVSGTYTITSDYISPDGVAHKATLGNYPISSVMFDKGEAKMKLGSQYYSLNDIKEIYE